jgi:hypothetical protein
VAEPAQTLAPEAAPAALEPAPAVEQAAPPPAATADVPAAATEVTAMTPAAEVAQEPETAAAAALDFESLVKRLRKTKAIKLSAKLAFKSQSDALLNAFRAYHRQRGTTTLAELRRSYDRLFSELHSLLADGDPPLDRDIAESRAAIWEVLADPRKFVASELMAGA